MSSAITSNSMTIMSEANVKTNSNGITVYDKLRVKLQGELQKIHAAIKSSKSTLNDEMSNEIEKWANDFSSKVKETKDNKLLENVINTQIRDLLEIIVDPITSGILDERAALGSDGNVYGYMTLQVAQHGRPEQLQMRSPLYPDDGKVFTTKPHPIVSAVCYWLKGYNALPRNEEIEKQFEAIMSQIKKIAASEANKKISIVPSTSAAPLSAEEIRRRKIMQVLAEQVSRDNQKSQEVQKAEAAFDAIPKEFAASISRMNIEADAKADNQQRRVAGLEEELVENNARMQLEIARLNNEIAILEVREAELIRSVNHVRSGTATVAAMDSQLQQQIEETRKVIDKKRKRKERIKKIVKAAAIAGACCFGTWALCSALKSASIGFSGSFVPFGKGGFDGIKLVISGI